MNRESQKNEEIEEVIPEAKIQHHTLSSPTVGKTHKWRQRGTAIVCDSCASSHGIYINVEDIMIGVDSNGMPRIGKKY